MNKKSQAWSILNYMQKNPKKEVLATDFMWLCIFKPFVWVSANARFSELKKNWLVEVVWTKKGVKKFYKISRDRLVFKITGKGLNYKLR